MLFEFVLYPHYLCEWVEWAGFWLIGGMAFVPARNFLLAEIATMAPRAVSGRRWYLEKFGRDKVGDKKAVIPGIL
jgi:3-oxo-5-alpha-steroid 4-dehydrogenase 1